MPPAGAILLHDLEEYTGAFSWTPNILRLNIELANPGYKSYDPATWPRISEAAISRLIGRSYDGSMALPVGVAAFDEDVMDLFLNNVAKDCIFNEMVSTENESRPDSTISLGFKDFPFVFTKDGTLKQRSRWCYMSPRLRRNYVKVLGPSPSQPTNEEQFPVAQGTTSTYPQPLSPLAHPSLHESGPPRPAAVTQEQSNTSIKQENIESNSSELPKSSEEAYREMLGMLEAQHSGIKEPQETSRAEEVEDTSRVALKQCENAVQQLIELARLEFRALRTELDVKVKGLDDKARKLEERAMSAEGKNSVLEQQLESCKRTISDLHEQVATANKKATSAHDKALAADEERRASDRRVVDLNKQLTSRDTELAAAKVKHTQADERLITIWAAMEKSRSSVPRKRKEASDSPGSVAAPQPRDTKRSRNDNQAYVDSGHDHDGHAELSDPDL